MLTNKNEQIVPYICIALGCLLLIKSAITNIENIALNYFLWSLLFSMFTIFHILILILLSQKFHFLIFKFQKKRSKQILKKFFNDRKNGKVPPAKKPLPEKKIDLENHKEFRMKLDIEVQSLRKSNHDLETQVSGINHLWGKTSEKNFSLQKELKLTKDNMRKTKHEFQQISKENSMLKRKISLLEEQKSKLSEAYHYDNEFTELDIL